MFGDFLLETATLSEKRDEARKTNGKRKTGEADFHPFKMTL